jgi:hypothetical protein
VSDFSLKERITVAAQFPNYTEFQRFLLTPPRVRQAYHQPMTLDIVLITAALTLGRLLLLEGGEAWHEALGGAFQAEHLERADQDI